MQQILLSPQDPVFLLYLSKETRNPITTNHRVQFLVSTLRKTCRLSRVANFEYNKR
jgi:hypothetical protein